MISARNTWTIYNIEPASGQIAWRLGGRHSSFTMGPGTGTAWQHDPRELPDGAISLFDNGASPTVHSQSRAIVVSLDGQTGAATLASRFTHAPPLVVESEGSVQSLANEDWFVGWGQEPFFTELSPDGAVLFEAHFPAHERSYRDLSFQWTGTPAHLPLFAFRPGASGGQGVVYASWNGATLVSSWRVLAGPSASSLTALTQVARSGFETAIPLPAGTSGPYLAVQALGAAGQVLGTSTAAAQAGLG